MLLVLNVEWTTVHVYVRLLRSRYAVKRGHLERGLLPSAAPSAAGYA